jgi:hypothetical protein
MTGLMHVVWAQSSPTAKPTGNTNMGASFDLGPKQHDRNLKDQLYNNLLTVIKERRKEPIYI